MLAGWAQLKKCIPCNPCLREGQHTCRPAAGEKRHADYAIFFSRRTDDASASAVGVATGGWRSCGGQPCCSVMFLWGCFVVCPAITFRRRKDSLGMGGEHLVGVDTG